MLEPVEVMAGGYRLRPPSPREAKDVLAMSHEAEIRMWNALTGVTDEETALAWCERWSNWNGGASAQWGVFDAPEGRLLGTISLFDIDTENSSAEIGYRVAPWARGRGVGTAALRSVADWAFGELGLTRLQLLHGLENPASCRVAAKSGFLLEGTLRSSYRYGDGELHDEHLHARLARDPFPPPLPGTQHP
ncbi:GNAT family N-acetyltransferase [Streptacidiphilus anmyonensis]|uniref:GNAT family N-acetyltransferase n=1 Tax=Streptacidiphilus anmyonensis TaxID=405782 RepID=UPI000A4C3048|nr:GNAT family protein [Streptacidiphilus anmyonensis]